MCAIITVVVPRPSGHPKNLSIPTNNIRIDKPRTTSGITKGAVTAPTKNDFPLKCPKRVITIAAVVPIIVDTVADIVATLMLVNVARKIIGSENRALYHFNEKPDQTLTNRDSLKEYMTMQTNGKYKNIYPKNSIILGHLSFILSHIPQFTLHLSIVGFPYDVA